MTKTYDAAYVTRTERFDGIDTFRAVAAFSVLLIHFNPFPAGSIPGLEIFIRFAVPYFFMASGFFFGLGVQKRGVHKQFAITMKKVCLLYIAWWLIYFLFPSRGEIRKFGFMGSYTDRWERVSQSAEHFLFFGPTTHLWFFPSLICALIGIYLLCSAKKNYRFLGLSVAIGFYIAGVLGGSYLATKFAVSLPTNSRHFLFFSMLPTFLGFEIAHMRPFRYQVFFGMLLLMFGFIAHGLEARYLFLNYDIPLDTHDYLFSTVFMAGGVFALALSFPNFICARPFVLIGELSGAIYLVHIFVLQKIPFLEPFVTPLFWAWCSPFLAFAIAAFLAWLMKRIPILKSIVP